MNSILEMSQDKVITMNIINTHHPIGSLKIFIIFHVGQKGHQLYCTTPQYYRMKAGGVYIAYCSGGTRSL